MNSANQNKPVDVNDLQGESHFRYRGESVSRLENLFDATIALALTFTLVSLDVPETFSDLAKALSRLPVFFICCVFLSGLWYVNYKFHRRYGLEDFITFVLNMLLIMLILYFIYPMKFLASLIFVGKQITMTEAQQLMYLYAGGFAAISIVFVAMYGYAWRKREVLGLNQNELRVTRFAAYSHLINFSVAMLAVGIAFLVPKWAPLAGVLFAVIGPLQFVNGWLGGKGITE